jgi:hypothetical protein
MKTYDKQKQLTRLYDALGLPRSFSLEIEVATKNNALSGSCNDFMSQVIHCLLCDLPQEARTLLIKSRTWMERALETREWEVQSKGFANRLQRKLYATIEWLHQGVHDQSSLDSCMADTMQWFRVHHPELTTGSELALSAITFIDAGAYDDYLTLAAPGGVNLMKPAGSNEKQMCLTLASQALTQKFPGDKMEATVKKFLDNHVSKWLNDGHSLRAAEWMKVVYWKRGEAGISPSDAVRKCLDHVEH